MRKNLFSKAIALVVCLAFAAIAVPGLNSTEKKIVKIDTSMLLMKPASFFFSIIPAIGSRFNSASTTSLKGTNGSTKPKPLGDLPSPLVPR